ncbi:minor capsid protein [Brachybacterium kimchii]|uniref:Minor capsid protein n=1 Tax=Brachybacterium kimchii TaxID=2942909 RepID=A0ABY4N7V2_9MICO|nr:minor capsid protein [Brachybacterium kimchii]UQN29480.1 minor capsid protein [Brachybacterium kimchii]
MSKDFTFSAGDPVDEAVRAAAARGLALAAEAVLAEANDKVPHEEGTLQRSGRASADEGELRAVISYDTPYAVRQHEDMTLHHKDGRTAKWLENALASNQEMVRRIIADAIKGAL